MKSCVPLIGRGGGEAEACKTNNEHYFVRMAAFTELYCMYEADVTCSSWTDIEGVQDKTGTQGVYNVNVRNQRWVGDLVTKLTITAVVVES